MIKFNMNIKSLFFFSLGPFLSAGIGLITLPLLTWFYTPEQIGIYNLFIQFSSFFLIISCLGFDQYYIRKYYDYNDEGLISLEARTKNINLVIVNILFLGGILLNYFFNLVKVGDWYIYIVLYLFLFFTVTMRYISSNFRLKSEGLYYSLTQFIPKFGFLILALATYYLLGDVNNEVKKIILIIVYSVSYIFFIFPFIIKENIINLPFKLEITFEVLKYSLPSFVSGVLFWVISSIDRFMLNGLYDSSVVGIYSVAMGFASIGAIVQTLFSTLWAPKIFKDISDDNLNLKDISKYLDNISILIVFVFIIVGLISPIIINFIPNEYSIISYILPGCMSLFLYYTLGEAYGVGINVVNRPILTTYISILCCVIYVLFGYYSISQWGILGAVIAGIWVNWLFFFLRAFVSRIVWYKFKLYKVLFYTFILNIFMTYLAFQHVYLIYFTLGWLLFFLLLMIVEHKKIIHYTKKLINQLIM